jgi:hypothetical protein
MIYKLGFTVFVLFCVFSAQAQINDDFSDGDFSQNPIWQGDNTLFKVNSSDQLQTQSSGVDTAYLTTANNDCMNVEWSIWAKQSFNSSDNNHSRIYLCSDKIDLEGFLNGYFLQFGSSNDNIALFRQDGLDTFNILNGTIHNTGSSVNTFRFKVTRDANGVWEVFADPTGGSNYISEGTVLDATYTTTQYFGVFCKHTSSNATKFYFDDFSVGTIQIDTVAPSLLQTHVVDQQKLELHFSEAVDQSYAQNVLNYVVDQGVGSPTAAVVLATNPSIVELDFANPFPSGVLLQITASNIADLNGNIANVLTDQFAYYDVQAFDIVINEIMADPSPVVGLPDYEYVELYNTSMFPIQLSNWKLRVGGTDKFISDVTIPAQSYLLLVDDAAEFAFSSYGQVYAFSSLSLTNSGTDLALIDDQGRLIHQVEYDDAWYANEIKENGGWSLEMMDYNNPCSCESNWSASNDFSGGTPGKVNSIFQNNPDQNYPEILRVSVLNPVLIRVHFSEVMDSVSVLNLGAYQVDNGMGNPVSVKGNFPSYKHVDVQIANPMQGSTIYTLSVQDSLLDCVGLHVDFDSEVAFGLPEVPEEGDVVINEILFNPKGNGVDFVELYNRSNKVIDLKFLALANWDRDLLIPSDLKQISEESWLLFPNSFVVLSTDGAAIKRQYYPTNENAFVDMTSFISMPNAEGEVLLVSSSGLVFDRVDYSEDQHYSLLNDVDGVSLEKIHFDRLSSDPLNWHSAAENVGFATPGYMNSHFTQGGQSVSELNIEPALFSPDNDGRDDVVSLTVNSESEGAQSCTIQIYDSQGRLVRNLIVNSVVSQSQTFVWDGMDDYNQKVGIGIYVVLVELHDEKGNVQHLKDVVTVAGKL